MAVPLIFTAAAVGFAAKVALRAIGVGIITIVGAAGLVTAVDSLAQQYLTALPGDVMALLGQLRIDLCINMALAGVTLRLTLAGAKRLGVL
jgi:hypothetical protein